MTTKIHSIVSDEKTAIVRQLSPGSAADDPVGQELMPEVPKALCKGKPLLMDKAYEGDACRAKARECGMCPVVPPKSNRKRPWKYDKKLYEGRNVVERNFRNIKQLRQRPDYRGRFSTPSFRRQVFRRCLHAEMSQKSAGSDDFVPAV